MRESSWNGPLKTLLYRKIMKKNVCFSHAFHNYFYKISNISFYLPSLKNVTPFQSKIIFPACFNRPFRLFNYYHLLTAIYRSLFCARYFTSHFFKTLAMNIEKLMLQKKTKVGKQITKIISIEIGLKRE